MTVNPFVNALVAAGYISVIVSFLFYTERLDSSSLGIIAPITFLSLFVLSAALMGYFILYQPLRLLIEGKQSEATTLFFSTLASFALITLAIIATIFLLTTTF